MTLKYLLTLAVLWLAFHLWRQGRREQAQRHRAAPPTIAPPQPMAQCAQCGLHLPAGDALPGRRGSYCCAAHRQAAEP